MFAVDDMVGVAKLVIAPGCGPGGRGFESHISPQKKDGYESNRLFSTKSADDGRNPPAVD